MIAVILFLLFEGGIKVFAAYKETGSERWWHLFNGLFTIFLAFLVWFFITANLGLIAIGLVLGLRLLVEGWTMFFLPERPLEPADTQLDTTRHPDSRLGLEQSQLVKEMQDAILARQSITDSQKIVGCLILLAVFFAIHVLRTDARWSFIGFISPFAAVLGDAAVALILAIVPDYAFYPRTDELTAKIKNEPPYWKLPFLVWLRVLHGYPFDSEMVETL